MNPVYLGKDVSYIDIKQGQRAAESAVGEGERRATLAWLAGAGYPAESLDKAWRQLVFGAHHDAITGTESDQVYLDLLGGWREAWQRGDEARRDAASYLAGLADTRPPGDERGRALTVFNTLSWPRSGVVRAALEFTAPGPASITVRDDSGDAVPCLAEGARQHPDGTVAAVTLTFRATDVPALGYRTYWATPAPGIAAAPATGPAPGGWEPQPGTVIENRPSWSRPTRRRRHPDPHRGQADRCGAAADGRRVRGPGRQRTAPAGGVRLPPALGRGPVAAISQRTRHRLRRR
jgi:hypothetical protein